MFPAKVHEKALKLQAIASLKVIMNPAATNHNGQSANDHGLQQNGTVKSISNGQLLTSDSTHSLGSNVDDNVTTREVIVQNAAFDTDYEDTTSQAHSQSNSLSKSPEVGRHDSTQHPDSNVLCWSTVSF